MRIVVVMQASLEIDIKEQVLEEVQVVRIFVSYKKISWNCMVSTAR